MSETASTNAGFDAVLAQITRVSIARQAARDDARRTAAVRDHGSYLYHRDAPRLQGGPGLGTPLNLPKDRHGFVIDYEASLIGAVETFDLPDEWPEDHELCRLWLREAATVFGVLVALDRMSMDEAYLWCRALAEEIWVHTLGALDWRDVYSSSIQIIDTSVERVGGWLECHHSRAHQQLRRIAMQAINAGGADLAVRRAVADAAEKISPAPPVDVLLGALNDAIAECRRNARWMTSRGRQA